MDAQQFLNNPLSIQKTILEDYTSRVNSNGEDMELVDANNTFAYLLETFSRVVGRATIAMDTKFNSLYSRRSSTTKELYQHMSDFDYVGFYSSPSSLKLSMMLHKDYLIDNAVEVPDTNYKLVTIPQDTIFTIGRFKLSLYYPIHIRINSIVGNVTAVYDTTKANPLYMLDNNGIPTRETNFGGIDLVAFDFDVFQFNKDIVTETINTDLGFNKRYKYENKFYAIRIYDVSGNEDVELAYTMSDSVYDISRPTAVLKVYPETNEIEVSVPQVYFSNGIVGNQIRLEIFDTQGALDVSIGNIELEDIVANFAFESPNTDMTYSNILKNIPTSIISPIDSRIVGGEDSYDFTQMKDAVVYHSGAETVPITTLKLERYFNSKGFKAHKKLDNLTDRRYHAYAKVKHTDDNKTLNVVNGRLTINSNEDSVNSMVRYLPNNSIVVLPTAIFKYQQSVSAFDIMSDDDRDALTSSSKSELADKLNTDMYLSNPYHLMIRTYDKYPTSSIYDLFDNSVDNIMFVEENIYLSAQLNLVSSTVKHLGDGSGGYTVRLGIQKSSEFDNIPEDDIVIYLSVETINNTRVGLTGTYLGDFDGVAVYDFSLETDYAITDENISITNLVTSTGDIFDQTIGLKGDFYLATFVKKSHFTGINQNLNILARYMEDDGTYLSVSLQKVNYRLGTLLDDVLDSNLLTNWTGEQYATHPVDVPLLYEHDEYDTNPDGTLINSGPIGTVVLNKLHSAGDPVLDVDTGDPIIKHTEGDTLLDAGGNPQVVASRVLDYTVELPCYDYRYHEVYPEFHAKLADNLKSYHSSVREIDQNILENTKCFFRPNTTVGKANFKLNNLVTVASDLNLSFAFNCYVTDVIFKDDDLLKLIKKKITDIVEDSLDDKVISLTGISGKIRMELSDYISSIDVVSMNGDPSIQTLVNTEIDKIPVLNSLIKVTDDDNFEFEPDIQIVFKQLDLVS